MWERFKALQCGLLVVGHGTRLASGARQLLELATQIRQLAPEVPIEASFLELCEPTIADGVVSLQRQGVRQLMVIPVLLFDAAHAQSDIPDAVRKAVAERGMTVISQTTPLGNNAATIELSERRFMEALRCQHPKGCLEAGACPQTAECIENRGENQNIGHSEINGGKIGLAMIGRGSSDPFAISQMKSFTAHRLAQSKVPIAWAETGFFAGSDLTVDDVLLHALGSGCETIVVQPHLLFEGELVQQLRQKVAEYQQSSPKQRWLVPPTLGADPHLAKAFYLLANEAIREFCLTGDKH